MDERNLRMDKIIEGIINRTWRREDGRFGVFIFDSVPFAVTLENDKLCIPAGRYLCKRTRTPTYGIVFEITGVPGRTAILIHWGNIDDNSKGCVLLGESFNVWSDGSVSVASSKIAFQEFMQRAEGIDSFWLTVKETWE